MNRDQFNELVDRRVDIIRTSLQRKGEEYADNIKSNASNNVFYNFERAAELTNVTPPQALLGMLSKHLVQVLDLASGNIDMPISKDFVDEKIGDTINYLILLEGLLITKGHVKKEVNW